MVDSTPDGEDAFDFDWASRGPLIEHLWRDAAENWIAEDHMESRSAGR